MGGRRISGADAHLSRCATLTVRGRGTTARSKVGPDLPCRLCEVQLVSGGARLGLPRHGAEGSLRLAPRNPPCHEQASQSPKMELDTSFAMLAPELSRLQVTTVNDSDEDMELED